MRPTVLRVSIVRWRRQFARQNLAAKIWRSFKALDLSGNDQVAFYDHGVGASSFKPFVILGGAFGFGLKRNVIDIYKFACRNYRSYVDRICGRGAFTLRVGANLTTGRT